MVSPLIVALDVNNLKEEEKLVKILSSYVSVFKVGLELFSSCGVDAIKVIKEFNKEVFLDLKLFDIPNTVSKTIEVIESWDIYAVSLHILGGKEMVEKASSLFTRPYLWGVTILSSIDRDGFKQIGFQNDLDKVNLDLALSGKKWGIDGIIISGEAVSLLRNKLGDDFTIVTPGIRLKREEKNDQKRVLTPKEAIKKGANYIVMGRPIINSDNPKETAAKVLNEVLSVKANGYSKDS